MAGQFTLVSTAQLYKLRSNMYGSAELCPHENTHYHGIQVLTLVSTDKLHKIMTKCTKSAQLCRHDDMQTTVKQVSYH